MSEELNTISKEQKSILQWTSAQKVNNTAGRIKQIEELSNNLLFNELWVEKSKDFQLIIVPIKETYKFSNNKGNKVSNYFVSVLNSASKISYSVIIQNKPDNIQNSTKIKVGAIADIYNGKALKENCNLRFITIYDYYLYEKNYKNNSLFSTLNLKKKPSSKNDTINENNTNDMVTCIAYYWVTTYSDGSQTEEYLTTICTSGPGVSNPNYPNEEYPDGSGGGGENPDPGVNVVRTVSYIVKEHQVGNVHWKIVGSFNIAGTKFNDIANNAFSSITVNGTGCLNYNPAYNGLPYMSGYFIFSSAQSCGLLSATTASGSVTAHMYYPNWPGGSIVESHTLAHIWHASTDLF